MNGKWKLRFKVQGLRVRFASGQRMGFSPACMERLSRDQLGDKRPNRIKRAGIGVEFTVFGVEAI